MAVFPLKFTLHFVWCLCAGDYTGAESIGTDDFPFTYGGDNFAELFVTIKFTLISLHGSSDYFVRKRHGFSPDRKKLKSIYSDTTSPSTA